MAVPTLPPAIGIPWSLAIVLLAISPFCLAYDRYKIWKWQRERNRWP